nr:reverse transcriptase domain-containing protein [Tanacetum cinerariifolium]
MGEATPKPKASARKKKGDSASSTTSPTLTPTTTVESVPRLSATAKGKQPSRATTPVEPTDIQRTEAEQLKIVLKWSRQETHISQQSGSCTDEGTARSWLEKEPPRLIFTWDDLVSKFINQFFPPSKTTNLRNKITNFQQRFDESFSEAWDRFKDLFRACPHYGFSELHQLDTFYNALNSKDQDSLNSAAGGNFLDKIPRECLVIIESKSKVRYSRNKPVVSKVSMNTSTSGISPDVAELKDMVKALLIDKKSQYQAPTTMKAVEESCVTCGGAHSYRNCSATDGNVYRDNIQEFVSQASAVNYNQGNTSYRPPMMSNQIRHPGFPSVPNNQNVQLNQRNNRNRFNQNQNRRNNFNQGLVYQPPVFQPPAYQASAPQTQVGYTVVGFGVCPDTCDPKLVKITVDKISSIWEVEVFMLSTRVWKTVYMDAPFDSYLRWFQGEASVCGVWTRKDGANELFTKIYTVKVEGKSLYGRVLGFRNNGDVVIEVVDDDHFGDSEIEVYEPSSGHINGVGINEKR